MPAIKRAARARHSPKPAMPARQRAVVLTRMSLDRADGAGHERQESACRALCDARGMDVVKVLGDTVSATKSALEDRPGWQRARKLIEAGEADLIVVYHLDRLTRSMRDLEDVIDSGIPIACASGDIDLSTDAGRLVGRILGAVARGEVERKGARQALALEQRAMAGKPWWANRPYGYERDGSLRQPEAELLREGYRALLNGAPIARIARSLGKPASTTREVLLAARNAGLREYRGEVVGEGAWQAIVDEPTWRAACRLLEDPARRTGAGPLANVLSGIAKCGKCGSRVSVLWRGSLEDEDGNAVRDEHGKKVPARKGDRGAYAIYICGAKSRCVSLPVDYAEGRVLLALTKQADALGTAELAPAETEDVAPLRAREADLMDRLAELGESYAEGEITRATMSAASRRIEAELAEVQRRIADAGRADALAGVDVEALYAEFEGMDLDRQRAIIRSAFESIRIMPRGRGHSLPKPEHVELTFTPQWTA